MRKIAGYRVMMNKTQQDIANYLSISRQAYSEKERGKTSFNDREKRMLKELFLPIDPNVSIDSLFF